ncbi:hypothetical protein TNIN_209801, partial [Trichonephila inaurata madagascariensis]
RFGEGQEGGCAQCSLISLSSSVDKLNSVIHECFFDRFRKVKKAEEAA